MKDVGLGKFNPTSPVKSSMSLYRKYKGLWCLNTKMTSALDIRRYLWMISYAVHVHIFYSSYCHSQRKATRRLPYRVVSIYFWCFANVWSRNSHSLSRDQEAILQDSWRLLALQWALFMLPLSEMAIIFIKLKWLNSWESLGLIHNG